MAKKLAWFIKDAEVVCSEIDFILGSQQKGRNTDISLTNLHDEIFNSTGMKTLEISAISSDKIGTKLSTFNLKLGNISYESFYQSSKVYQYGGPYKDLCSKQPARAKKDKRHFLSGRLVGFSLDGELWEANNKSAFYDYTYLRFVTKSITPDELKYITSYDCYTDLMSGREQSKNCQARSIAALKLICELRTPEVLNNKSTWLNFYQKYING